MHNLHIFINTYFTIDKTEMHEFQISVKKKTTAFWQLLGGLTGQCFTPYQQCNGALAACKPNTKKFKILFQAF